MPPVSQMWGLYEKCFREVGGKKMQNKFVLLATRRMRQLVNTYRVYAPVTPYMLNLGKAAISGEYAVLASRKTKRLLRELSVLRLREAGALHRPNLVNHARWLHLRNAESGKLTIRVINFSLFDEDIWREPHFEERQIRAGLMGFVQHVIESPGTPEPGAHCASCLSHGCMFQSTR